MKQGIYCLILLLSHIVHANIILVSIPKCGTHLAIKCIKHITGLNFHGHSKSWIAPTQDDLKVKFLAGHAIYTPECDKQIRARGSKGVFILRDPRDHCVSWVYFARKRPDLWPYIGKMDIQDALSHWIGNTTLIHSELPLWSDQKILKFGDITDFYQRFLPWMNHPSFITVKFENLIGPKGGGSLEDQLQEIKKIAAHLGYPLTERRAFEIAQSLFGNPNNEPSTFRSGQIGSWKEHFSPELKTQFKEVAGPLLTDLGYEKDFNW